MSRKEGGQAGSYNLKSSTGLNVNRGKFVATKANMFNNQASDPKSKPDEILKILAIQP
jgi:hypothetical protein